MLGWEGNITHMRAQQFATPILDAAIERKRREGEAFRQGMVCKIFAALAELRKTVPFREAYIFGSIIRPYGFTERSDIDIAFIGLDDNVFFTGMSFLSREVGVDVDVIQLEGHRLANKIMREGIRWTGSV
jgi:predicted nucleotidyltransferase